MKEAKNTPDNRMSAIMCREAVGQMVKFICKAERLCSDKDNHTPGEMIKFSGFRDIVGSINFEKIREIIGTGNISAHEFKNINERKQQCIIASTEEVFHWFKKIFLIDNST